MSGSTALICDCKYLLCMYPGTSHCRTDYFTDLFYKEPNTVEGKMLPTEVCLCQWVCLFLMPTVFDLYKKQCSFGIAYTLGEVLSDDTNIDHLVNLRLTLWGDMTLWVHGVSHTHLAFKHVTGKSSISFPCNLVISAQVASDL